MTTAYDGSMPPADGRFYYWSLRAGAWVESSDCPVCDGIEDCHQIGSQNDTVTDHQSTRQEQQ
ncbi:hypothetical protein [Kitasatospora sp. NPDC001175]|uniref:hypothetical protein n=1 Tax=Kitasatospora sp. NPDC001175 TaxID=3157103 RepID=UPI003D036057